MSYLADGHSVAVIASISPDRFRIRGFTRIQTRVNTFARLLPSLPFYTTFISAKHPRAYAYAANILSSHTDMLIWHIYSAY